MSWSGFFFIVPLPVAFSDTPLNSSLFSLPAVVWLWLVQSIECSLIARANGYPRGLSVGTMSAILGKRGYPASTSILPRRLKPLAPESSKQ